MSNIRAYEKKKEMNSDTSFRKKIFRHRLRIFYRILLGLLLLAAVGILLYIQMENRIFTGYQVLSSVERNKVENAISKNYNGNILTYSNDGMNCMDIKGNVRWNQTYEMQNPLVTINGKIAAVADYNGRVIYVMNEEGMLGEVQTGMPIRDFCISKDGVVAAVLDDSGVNAIKLYNAGGKELAYFKTTMKKSGYPLALSISDNSEIVMISYLYVDSGLLTSNVAFYNFGEVGQNASDNYVSGYSYPDAVVPEVSFMNNMTSFAIADNKLVFYKGKQIPTTEAGLEIPLNEEAESIYYDSRYVGLVFMNQGGDSRYRIDIYNDAGKLVHTQNFDLDYRDIYFNNDNIVIYNDSECAIYDLKGREKFKGSFQGTIAALLPTNKIYQYTVVTSDKIETIELK